MKEILNSASFKIKLIVTSLVALFFIFNIVYVPFIYTNSALNRDKLFTLMILSDTVLILFICNSLYQLTRSGSMLKGIADICRDESVENNRLLNSVSDGIMVVDRKGKVTTVNQSLCNILGFEQKDIINNNIYNILNLCNGSPDNRVYPRTVIESLETQKELKQVERTIARESEVCYINISTYILKNKNKRLIGVLAVVHDITYRKRLEQQLIYVEKMAATGQIAAELAHEIKNPICSIKGLMQIIGKKHSLEDNKYYDVITNELDRINVMLQRFLNFSQTKPKLENTNIKRLVEEIAPLIESYAERKNININIDMQKEIPGINADQENIKQVIVNIIQNGIDVLPEYGSMNVSIWYDQINELVKMEFKDNGSGIKPEYLDKIFEPFFTTKKDGSGLGLAISRKIIENHCGKLFAFNNQDGGATFAIELPVAKCCEVREDKFS